MWIDAENSDIARTHSDIRALRPNWSGPEVLTDEMIAELGFKQVAPVAPEYDPLRQAVTEVKPEMVDGVWTQKWKVSNLDDAAIEANLAAARSAGWEKIKAERDRREYLGFQLGEHWFHSDVNSQVKYLGLKDKARDLLAAGGALTDVLTEFGQPLAWHTLDNDDIPVTAQMAFDLVAAVAKLQAMLFGVAKQHKAKMEASERPDLYEFSEGWPKLYVEPVPKKADA